MTATADQSTMLDALRLARSARTDVTEGQEHGDSRDVNLTAAACLLASLGVPHDDTLVADLADVARTSMIWRLRVLGHID